jgi:hypothetical protein
MGDYYVEIATYKERGLSFRIDRGMSRGSFITDILITKPRNGDIDYSTGGPAGLRGVPPVLLARGSKALLLDLLELISKLLQPPLRVFGAESGLTPEKEDDLVQVNRRAGGFGVQPLS